MVFGEIQVLAHRTVQLQLRFGIRRGGVRYSATVQSLASREEAAFCRYWISKTEKARRSLDVDIHRFKTTPNRIEFVPKASPPGCLAKTASTSPDGVLSVSSAQAIQNRANTGASRSAAETISRKDFREEASHRVARKQSPQSWVRSQIAF